GDQDYAKYNVRSNVEATIAEDLTISVDFGARFENRHNLVQNSFLMAAWLQYQKPVYRPKTPDGLIANTNFGLTAYLDKDLSGYIDNQRSTYEGTLNVNYKVPFVTGLSLNLKASRDMFYSNQKHWEKQFDLYTWNEATQNSMKVSARGSDYLILYNWNSSASR